MVLEQPDGGLDGCLHAGGVSDATPGDVEGGAVAGAGTDQRESERHVDGGVEPDQLQGDVALVVVHGEDPVEFTSDSTTQQGVGGEGTAGINAVSDGGGDCRSDRGLFLVAEETRFTGVRVQRTNADPGRRTADLVEKPIEQLEVPGDPVDRQQSRDTGDRGVQCDVGDAETVWVCRRCPGGREVKHHGDRVASAGIGEQFGVARDIDAGGVGMSVADLSISKRINALRMALLLVVCGEWLCW